MSRRGQPTVKLIDVAAHRRVEEAFARACPNVSLMKRAAQFAFESCVELCIAGGRVVILAGPGNNGGDAWVLARLLKEAWYNVTIIARQPPKAPEAVDAAAALEAAGIRPVQAWPGGRADLIVDGLFGIGLRRPPDDWSGQLIRKANASGWPVLSLDVPSGLEADTGVAHEPCIRATRTVSFIAGKPGLYTGDGPDHAGEIRVTDLGTLDQVREEAGGEWVIDGHPLLQLPARRHNSHKGSFGSVGIIGGAPGMVGAGILAARAALRSGCGKAFLGLLDDSIAWDPACPEIMIRRARELIRAEALNTLVVGPGLGTADPARALVGEALRSPLPLVLDADALNLLATGKALQTLIRRRNGPVVLTPHPAEAARLLGCETRQVQQDRLGSALNIAERLGATVILKGAGSVIASDSGRWFINASGNPGMASAGMGDVLSGILGALLAQCDDSLQAACLGTWLHGRAADEWVAEGRGPAGLLASDVISQLPSVRGRLSG